MLDCYDCDPKAVRDLGVMYRILDELPERIGMTKITKPYLFFHKDRPEEEPGITGIIIIAESHISLHSFPARGNYLTMDVYSCKEFQKDKVKAFVKELCNPKKIEEEYVYRGKLFLKNEEAPAQAHKP